MAINWLGDPIQGSLTSTEHLVGPNGLMLFPNLWTFLLMVSTMTSSGYPLPKNKFLICSNSLLILLSEQILRDLNMRHLIRLTFLDLGAKASNSKYKPVNVGFLYILVTKTDERRLTNTSKNGNLLSFSSSI